MPTLAESLGDWFGNQRDKRLGDVVVRREATGAVLEVGEGIATVALRYSTAASICRPVRSIVRSCMVVWAPIRSAGCTSTQTTLCAWLRSDGSFHGAASRCCPVGSLTRVAAVGMKA